MPLAPDDPLVKAVAAYQVKDLDQTAHYCRAALAQNPDHAAAMHLLGVVEFGLGHPDEAVRLMRRAIDLKPGFAEIHYSFAQVLAVTGARDEALVHYRKTLEIKPVHAEAWLAMGNLLAGMGDYVQSEEAYRRLLALNPNVPEALNNLGVFCFDRGAYDEAEAFYRRALTSNPSYAAAHNNLGNVHKERKEWGDAARCYRQALMLEPRLEEALNNMGLVCMYGTGDLDDAIGYFDQLLSFRPDYVPALTHRGVIACMQGAFEDGVGYYEKALGFAPLYRDALNNLGNALKALGRLDDAIAIFRRVVELSPDDAEVHNNLALTLLAKEQNEEAWREYEWRWRSRQMSAAVRDFPQPQWQGEAGQGRTLLIHAEQGFGDTLQFCRYVPMAAQLGWRVVVEVQPELAGLLCGLAGAALVLPRGADLPPFDAHCPMMSLPLALIGQGAVLPSVPYLAADAAKVAAWAGKVAQAKPRLKVGLVWSGNPRLFSLDLSAANKRRSIDPALFAPLADLADVAFFSLQKDPATLPPLPGLVDLMDSCADFSDTAALIANLDLVISVDTAVAHLAGALGKPVWLLNRFDTCWRWSSGAEDSTWYPTLRQFRQPRSCDWTSVIARVRTALKELASC